MQDQGEVSTDNSWITFPLSVPLIGQSCQGGQVPYLALVGAGHPRDQHISSWPLSHKLGSLAILGWRDGGIELGSHALHFPLRLWWLLFCTMLYGEEWWGSCIFVRCFDNFWHSKEGILPVWHMPCARSVRQCMQPWGRGWRPRREQDFGVDVVLSTFSSIDKFVISTSTWSYTSSAACQFSTHLWNFHIALCIQFSTHLWNFHIALCILHHCISIQLHVCGCMIETRRDRVCSSKWATLSRGLLGVISITVVRLLWQSVLRN